MKLPDPDHIQSLPPDGGPEFNRLIFEKSPYLLQHARNPVDWYPWGDAAFERAHAENKPVFLSVGYATCHWCHVMERESFEDVDVARLMNGIFVCVKVDREERPDIDAVYMSVTQALSGHGGWPMTVILTPDKQPFFAGTYFPKQSRHGRPGMIELATAIREAWTERRHEVVQSANEIMTRIRSLRDQDGVEEAPGQSIVDEAFLQWQSQFDAVNGGFGQAPKFPMPHNLSFLLRFAHRTGRNDALAMVEKTLTAMRRGGLYDHVGFGFHRYSTDERWFLPHFEKMLYDQAMLAIAYTEAYQVTRKDSYKNTAEEIVAYVLRDMTDRDGGFYSAEDADSEGEEGKFYQWTYAEMVDALGETDAGLWCDVFHAGEDGNCYEEATRELNGRNIFFTDKDADVLADELGLREDVLLQKLDHLRRKLFDRREGRMPCFKDDKILTDWNGLMIAALAKAAKAFQKNDYTDAAARAALFVLTRLRSPDGRLMKRYRAGDAGLPAHLEDYAFLVWGLLELYEATWDASWLKESLALTHTMIAEFHDSEKGGFFMTRLTPDELPFRPKEIYDGAIPSGNSVAALNLYRLGRMTDNGEFIRLADGIGKAFSPQISRYPAGFCQYLIAKILADGPSREIVIVGPDRDSVREFMSIVQTRFLPGDVVLVKIGEGGEIGMLSPFVGDYVSVDGKPSVYVCENFACQTPIHRVEELEQVLRRP